MMDHELPGGVFTADVKREHVLAYVGLAHGLKGEYLRRHGVTRWQISGWRAAMYAGTLEVGLVPRDGMFLNDPDANRELVRLTEQVEALRQELLDVQAAHERELAGRQAEVEAGRAAIEALGKAIVLLQSGNGSAGSTTGR